MSSVQYEILTFQHVPLTGKTTPVTHSRNQHRSPLLNQRAQQAALPFTLLERLQILLTAVQNCGAGECRGGLILQRTDV